MSTRLWRGSYSDGVDIGDDHHDGGAILQRLRTACPPFFVGVRWRRENSERKVPSRVGVAERWM